MAFHVNQIVIYENRRCQIISLNDHTAKLKNLTPINESDWSTVEITLTNIKEVNHDE